MACKTALISAFGMNAVGGLLGGVGLGNLGAIAAAPMGAVGAVAGQIGAVSGLSGIVNSLAPNVAGIVSLGGNPLTVASAAVSGAVSGLGSSFAAGAGALTNALGSGFSSIGGTGILNGINLHTSDLFGSSPIQMVQGMISAESFAGISSDFANTLADMSTMQFGSALSALNSTLPFDQVLSGFSGNLNEFASGIGNFGNFLGDAVGNIGSMVTNGLTSFLPSIESIPGFAGDMINLGGAFNINDIANFGNPGQLINNLLASGAGEVTGVLQALSEVGINPSQFGNLASGQFNDILNDALGMVTNPDMLSIAQDVLGSKIPGLESLADFTNLAKVLPTSFEDIPFDKFEQFAEDGLSNIDLGSIATPKQFGNLVNNLAVSTLPIIENVKTVLDTEATTNIATKFLGGTGTNNSITVSDMMGSVAGVNFKEPMSSYLSAMQSMEDEGAFTQLNTLYSQLNTGMTGAYNTGSTYGVDTIVDPYDSTAYDDMDAFVIAKTGQIDSEVTSIAGNSTWSGAFNQARASISEVQKKIVDEKSFLAITDLHLDYRTNDPTSAYGFALGMKDRVLDSDKMAMVQGLADARITNDDKFGSYMRAFANESYNQNLTQPLSIRWRGNSYEDNEMM